MRLTKITIYGFKSFARRVEFEFGTGISAVVGPNGCGKSNLVDALRWALGEQRPSLLRTSTMPDLLYRGNHAKVPYAEVEITLDNEDQMLNVPETEVVIKRRLDREGDSSYQINQRPVRLKDIKDLLLDTGLGVGGYSFMGQGRIDAILNSSPFERRLLIEEAAGTSRYRVRRKEALRKLERTEQDLARASDLLEELERRVRSLKIQAGKARNYVEKESRLKHLLAVLYARRHRELQSHLAELAAEKQSAVAGEQALQADLARSEKELAARSHEETQLATDLSDARTEFVEKRAKREHLKARTEDLRTRAEQAARDAAGGEAQAKIVAEQLEELSRRRHAAKAEYDQIAEQGEALLERRKEQEQQLARSNDEERALNQRLDEIQNKLLDLVEEAQRLRNEVADLDSELRALLGSHRKLIERSAELVRQIETLAGRNREQNAAVDKLHERRTRLERELSAHDDELSELYQDRQNLIDSVGELKASAARDKSRLEVLTDAIARHEGVDEQVRRLLARAKEGEPGLESVEGIVADLITAPVATARAVEAALGSWAEAIVVADREGANRLLAVLRRDRLDKVRILSRAELIQDHGSNGGDADRHCRLLEDAVVTDKDRPLFEALLHKFDVLPGDVPLDLCSPRPPRSLVTKDGELMLSRFELMSRSSSERMGLITRRTEAKRLSGTVSAAAGRIEHLEQDLEQLSDRITSRKQDREERARRLEELVKQESEAVQDLRAGRDRLLLLREELVLDQEEVQELARRRAAISNERQLRLQKAEQIEAVRQESHEERQTIHIRMQETAAKTRVFEQELAQLDLEAARLKERTDGSRKRCDDLELRLAERTEESEQWRRRLEGWNQQELTARESAAGTDQEVGQLAAELERLEEALSVQSEAFEQFRTASLALQEQLAEIRTALDERRQQLQRIELKEQEQRLHLTSVQAKAVEDLQIDPELLARRLEGAPETEELASEAKTPAGELEEPPESAEDDQESDEQQDGTTAAGEAPVVVAVGGNGSTAPPTATEPREKPVATLQLSPEDEAVQALLNQDLEQLSTEANELKASLQRIGPVNLEAIDELDEVESRSTFLANQKNDLTESRRRLRKMIDEIDRECEVRFAGTFEQVKEEFHGLFRRLFGGGRADLVLQQTEDPSEAGVEVVAAPPGKDPRSLQALSGGERTLTATAILFSLFATRPSPFCVLDEVDAALDETNIERFTSMVKDFLERTQFLIVTHSKRTMSVADTLYGVTMQADGISKPIAMRFDNEQARSVTA